MVDKIPPKHPVSIEALLADVQNSGESVKSEKPTINLPYRKNSTHKGRLLGKRKVSEVKNPGLPSIQQPKRKQPHHNAGYMGGGAAAMMVGAGILALAPPVSVVGIPIFAMGLMAYAYAFCNFDNMPQPMPDHHNQQKENDKRKKDKDDKDDRDKNNPVNDSGKNADGKFVAEPVDYSGGPVKQQVKNGPPANLPQLPPKPAYTGPSWQDIYNTLTQQLGIPPAMASNFMNEYGRHLASMKNLSPEQFSNPYNIINTPMAMNYAHNYVQQQVGAGGVPRVDGINFMPPAAGLGMALQGGVAVAPYPYPAQPIVINIQWGDRSASQPGARFTLPYDFNNWHQQPASTPWASQQVRADIEGEIINTWNANHQQKKSELAAQQEAKKGLDEIQQELNALQEESKRS